MATSASGFPVAAAIQIARPRSAVAVELKRKRSPSLRDEEGCHGIDVWGVMEEC